MTGGLDLARRTGAPYPVNAADEVAFARDAVVDGDRGAREGDACPVRRADGLADLRGEAPQGGDHGSRTSVRTVISLGANTRSGGPQIPVPRLT